MKTPSERTRVHSNVHNNDAIYHWHRKLTGEEAGQLFDQDEQLLCDRLTGDPLNVILHGDSFQEASGNREIIR